MHKKFQKIRDEDFPFFQKNKNLIYFDNAATTQKPKVVVDRLTNFYLYECSNVNRGVYDLSINASNEFEEVRKKVAKFLNINDQEQIIFTSGVTECINFLANSYGALLKEGDEIILSNMEHNSNLVPWQVIAKKNKLNLKFIPIDDNAMLRMDVFENELISNKTKLICITHSSNLTGVVTPIKKIIEIAGKYKAKVFVDGSQAISHMHLDLIKDLDIDFYAFSSHKMYGPNGVGILYGKKKLLNKMSPYHVGGGMVQDVDFNTCTFQKIPWKFEAGTPSIGEILAFGTAIDYIEKIGRDNIKEYESYLCQYATKKLKENIKGIKILGDVEKKSPIISFYLENIHALDIGVLLNLQKICVRTGSHCSQLCLKHFKIDSVVRASFGIYNNISEIDFFIKVLKEITDKF